MAEIPKSCGFAGAAATALGMLITQRLAVAIDSILTGTTAADRRPVTLEDLRINSEVQVLL